MKCPRCDANVSDTAARCTFCGQDLTLVHDMHRISNSYYNLGLEKARVNDMSGAIDYLKKSLEFDKKNTEARNLLGLVYYEIGEITMALSEWVLSKYFSPNQNQADYYVSEIRKDQTYLDMVNQAIKKYNVSLSAVKAGNIDLAVIQLKKVTQIFPNFLRAQQLLALLYIEQEEFHLAAKCLNQARRLDFNNTRTLRYMQEIGDKTVITDRRGNTAIKKSAKTSKKQDPLKNVVPVGTYQEEKRSMAPVVYGVLGVVLGIIISIVLIRPTIERVGISGGGDDSQVEAQKTQIDSLEKEKEELNTQIEQLQKKITEGDTQAQNKLKNYEKLVKGAKDYINGDTVTAAIDVVKCTKDDFDSDEAKELYTKISFVTTEQIAQLVSQGRQEMYTSYDTAIATFKKVLKLDSDNQDAMFYMARCYQRKEDYKKAKKWYEKAIALDSASTNGVQAQEYLNEVKTALGEDTTTDTTQATSEPQTEEGQTQTAEPTAEGTTTQ